MKKTAILYSLTLIVGSALIFGINHWITAAQSTPSPTQQTQQTSTAPVTCEKEILCLLCRPYGTPQRTDTQSTRTQAATKHG